jgi:hypothetical protein
MTLKTTVYLGSKKVIKAYDIHITERHIVDGRIVGSSLHRSSFQIKDLEGYTDIEFIKAFLISAFNRMKKVKQ